MKVALCFIINYEHILNKESIWREWIEPNKDIINIYFYYKDLFKIKSHWIKKHTIPPESIYETSYYHVIPAYLSLLKFSHRHDPLNQWFCFLTDSCCPIISPKRFRHLFYSHYNKSILSWRKAWWNPSFYKRANLRLLKEELRLANDPWFLLKRENVIQVLQFTSIERQLTKTICDGGLANESLFAIILYRYKEFRQKSKKTNGKEPNVINSPTHITDWSRMTTSTSPHLFKTGCEKDREFIEKTLKENEYAMFIRKIDPEFPDEILKYFIYDRDREKDCEIQLRKPFYMIFIRWKKTVWGVFRFSLNALFIIYMANFLYSLII